MESPVKLRAAMLAAIGRELRLVYADIFGEGVPEHFAAILRRLDDSSNEGSPPAASSESSQDVSRDGGLQNGSETHEGRVSSLTFLRREFQFCSTRRPLKTPGRRYPQAHGE